MYIVKSLHFSNALVSTLGIGDGDKVFCRSTETQFLCIDGEIGSNLPERSTNVLSIGTRVIVICDSDAVNTEPVRCHAIRTKSDEETRKTHIESVDEQSTLLLLPQCLVDAAALLAVIRAVGAMPRIPCNLRRVHSSHGLLASLCGHCGGIVVGHSWSFHGVYVDSRGIVCITWITQRRAE